MNKLVFALALSASSAFAEEVVQVEQPRGGLGVDAAVVVPTGDYGDAVQIGAGALARYEHPLGQGFVYGRAGIIFHGLKDGVDGSLILVPLYGGYRHPLGDSGAYVSGELGITYASLSVDTQFGEMSDSETELGAMFSAGLRRGSLDIRGALFLPDADDAGDGMGIMGSAGYSF